MWPPDPTPVQPIEPQSVPIAGIASQVDPDFETARMLVRCDCLLHFKDHKVPETVWDLLIESDADDARTDRFAAYLKKRDPEALTRVLRWRENAEKQPDGTTVLIRPDHDQPVWPAR